MAIFCSTFYFWWKLGPITVDVEDHLTLFNGKNSVIFFGLESCTALNSRNEYQWTAYSWSNIMFQLHSSSNSPRSMNMKKGLPENLCFVTYLDSIRTHLFDPQHIIPQVHLFQVSSLSRTLRASLDQESWKATISCVDPEIWFSHW